MPSISVIVPVYNVRDYLDECVSSLLGQTMNDIEIILVDDGSTDGSGELCDRYARNDPRVKVIHQENMGLGLARNSGLQAASGTYIGFVDSDDVVSLRFFETLYNTITQYDADIAYCGHLRFSDVVREPEHEKTDVRLWNGREEIRQYLLDRIGLPPEQKRDNLYGAAVWCGLYSHRLLKEHEVCFVSERVLVAEDIIFDIDVIPHCGRIVHIDEPLYFYRFNPDSLTGKYKEDRFEKNVTLYHAMRSRLSALGYTSSELFEPLSRYYLTFARVAMMQEGAFLRDNGYSKARKAVKRICRAEDLQEILSKYPYRKLPVKYALICSLQKSKAYDLLLLMMVLHSYQ